MVGIMDILECIECGYQRSTEDDGLSFNDVCEICYTDDCPNMIGPKLLCSECEAKEGIFQNAVFKD